MPKLFQVTLVGTLMVHALNIETFTTMCSLKLSDALDSGSEVLIQGPWEMDTTGLKCPTCKASAVQSPTTAEQLANTLEGIKLALDIEAADFNSQREDEGLEPLTVTFSEVVMQPDGSSVLQVDDGDGLTYTLTIRKEA